MPFKNKKNAVKMCGLCILLFIFFVISTKIGVEMEKRSLFNAAIAFRISSFIFYLCFVISFLTIFIKMAVTNNLLLALFYLLLIAVSCPCLSVLYLNFDRAILNLSRPTFPERFIKNPVTVKQISSLAEELISRRNIYWVENRGRESIYGIGFTDGAYIFNSCNIPKDYRFDIPVKSEEINLERYIALPDMSNKRTSGSKVIDKYDYEVCTRASALIRRIGFDDVKFYPEPNIVRYEIRDTLGWDSPVYYYVYYYSQSTQPPDNFKYESKLNDNWYFDSKPRF
ncbi:MAG: hypothetical protein ABSB11_05355 [Sedimentisphaerales bacterium]|jgi:amino acid transporter